MTSTARPMGRVSGRLRLAVAGAAVLTALTVATAGASVPASMSGAEARLGRLGAGLSLPADSSTRPRTPVPGFLLERGRYTRFDAPGAQLETGPTGINNRGQLVGYYLEADADATYHGFLRDARGRFTTIDLPGAKATVASRVNDRGQLVGRYYQTAPFRGPDARFRGFLLDRGKLTRIDVPGAAQTQAVGVNNLGQVVGEYQSPDGIFHGFLWRKGRFTTIDLPGAAGTSLMDVNDRGQILGISIDQAGSFHGLLLDRGRFTTFDAPGVRFTVPRDINNRGQIAGFTVAPTEQDPLAGARGFLLAKGVKGPFTPIEVPGAPRNLVTGLNDRNQLVGSYENTAATPAPQPTGTGPMGRMA
jgi:probable HAF family extracellular repeat protein